MLNSRQLDGLRINSASIPYALGAKYPSPKKANLFNYGRVI